ncbi:21518_t:CDS:2, partial [Cetraspora pellucida]
AKKPAIFRAINQKNYTPDELHLLLRISDILMECFFNNLTKQKEFKKKLKPTIEAAFKDLSIRLEFFKSEIYQYKVDAENWVRTFCYPTQGYINFLQNPGLYRKANVTPYMHVFAKHVPLFMQQLKAKGLSLQIFSTSSIEKKNHNRGTIMGGGNKEKSVIYDIMSYENRQLFYLTNSIPKEITARNIDANNKENIAFISNLAKNN